MEKNEDSNLIILYNFKNISKSKDIETLNKDEKIRFYIIDNFRGILIFMVIFSQFLFDYSSLFPNSFIRKIVVFIFCFHIQAFIFISGFLSSENTIKFVNTIKLLIIYYIFNFAFSLFIHLYKNNKSNFQIFHNPYLYLLSLFIWRISIKFLNSLQFIFLFSIIISIVEGYCDYFSVLLTLGKTIVFFPYFLLGYKIQNQKLFLKFLFLKKGFIKKIIFAFSFLFFLYFVFLFINKNKLSNSALLMNIYDQNNNINDRISLMIISSIMILNFLLILPNHKIFYLSECGKNSLYIYLFHRFFTIFVQEKIFIKPMNEHLILLSFIFSLIIMLLFGNNFVRKYHNSFIDLLYNNINNVKTKGRLLSLTFYLSLIIILALKPLENLFKHFNIFMNNTDNKNIYIQDKSFKMNSKSFLEDIFGIKRIKKNYSFENNSYYDNNKIKNNFCRKLNNYSEKTVYKLIYNSNTITFIGDSITEGTKNGYHPWYEPMIYCFKNKKIINISKGSYTTKLIIKNFQNDLIKSNSDLYFIALGTNDIRYRRASICSMDSIEYINNIDNIVNLTKTKNSKYIFIAPWFSTSKDPISNLNHTEKIKMMKNYSSQLKTYSKKSSNYIYINPNNYIEHNIRNNGKKYLVDYIHPNKNYGIELYSQSILENSN